MDAKRLLLLLIFPWMLTGCMAATPDSPQKLVLLAPFEGRYREIGYNALYSARLALADNHSQQLELLTLDDGGTIENAARRAAALRQDETIAGMIILGPFATAAEVQAAFPAVPVMIVGYWGSEPSAQNVFALSNPAIPDEANHLPFVLLDQIRISAYTPAGDLYALSQIPAQTQGLQHLQIISSGSLPDEDFRERYLSSALFPPEPGLLAVLTYDAIRLLHESLTTDQPLDEISYEGLSGTISFSDQYWENAPLNRYSFQTDGNLEAVSQP